MKRTLATVAVAALLAGPALAQNTDMLRDQVESALATDLTDIDVDLLSNDQLSALYVELNSADSPSEKQAAIDSIVADDQYVVDETMMDPVEVGSNAGVRSMVENQLAIRGYDVEEENLTDEQVAGLYLALTTGDDTDAAEIESILN